MKINNIDLDLNYNYQQITPQIFELLIALADEAKLREKSRALFSGEKINTNEQRPALHTALRDLNNTPLFIDDTNVMLDIVLVREKMRIISQQIRAGEWYGYCEKPIKNIINIGIGGSDLGPKFCLNAFKDYVSKDLNYYFISDADPVAFQDITELLNPEETLFIITSKSFDTPETIYNMHKAFNWLGNKEKSKERNCIAITANPSRARQYGINNILPLWDWIGGRYSICSAVNLITCIAIGYKAFLEFLNGAYLMDSHFLHQDFYQNMPVILALLGLWNINFPAYAVY